ncbi:MAG: undecaprenyldiphospho-muramoylpentapeptide beta-N-acetylglucosaminyltransferase [Candidatus Moranbacteria bacterium]|nr:undecaprenyldiphospho-muramoylpentapeptide beta-N-acetylglucosaminyltransferase [Candidatus Moranbacteria bacterium]
MPKHEAHRNELRIVLTGGLTGGHLFPLLAVAKAVANRSSVPVTFLYLGPPGRFGCDAVRNENIPVRPIVTGKLRRYFSFRNVVDPFKAVIGFVQSIWYLYAFMPDVVFAKGGAVSVPVCLAAWALRIPFMIHDSDAVPGAANRMLAGFASRIAVAYPSAAGEFPVEKTAVTGNPVRPELSGGIASRADSYFGFASDKPLVLVLGGSLGAKSLNAAVARMLPDVIRETQILHQTGEAGYAETVSIAGEYGIKAGREGYVVTPFLSASELADALVRADIVISRAGASTVSELAAFGKPSILVPLPTAANDEQRMNAYQVAGIGGAVVLEESNLGEHILSAKVDALLRDGNLREAMSEAIRAFHNPAAADMLADGIIGLSANA